MTYRRWYFPDMPKSQPCPECSARSKRTIKLATGAYYKCPVHGEFLIRSK